MNPLSRTTVTLSGCTADDARTVLSHLDTHFGSGAHLGNSPAPPRPTVWTAQVDTSTPPATNAPPPTPPTLHGRVDLTAQGTPQAIATLKAALAEAFTVHDQGYAPGDQEQEIQLHLTGQ